MDNRSETPLPQYCPGAREIDDVELLRMGALESINGFEGPEGDVTLIIPVSLLEPARRGGGLEIVDPEGVPLAVVEIEATYWVNDTMVGVVGRVQALAGTVSRPFQSQYLPASTCKGTLDPATLTVPVTRPLSRQALERITQRAGPRPILLLALTGEGTAQGISPHALVRATLQAARTLDNSHVVAVPAASRGQKEADHEFHTRVAEAYSPDGKVYWVDADGDLPSDIYEVVSNDQPSGTRQGVVVFFTGLSGSGKSTVAQALRNWLLETGSRTVTLLDGDRVRRNLSQGLTFSREDRKTNIERIGWVAAEIGRHGGFAICSPIAPFDQSRKAARHMAEAAGSAFVLVHVATPLAECERRDAKGLYAKARRDGITEFTGISSPYEVPSDAELRIDTNGVSMDEVLDTVLSYLAGQKWIDREKASLSNHLPKTSM